MSDNQYVTAGWMAVIQAILFPVIFVVGFIELGITRGMLGFERPVLGPSDLLGVIFTLVSVYVLWKFKQLLNERYEYHDLDLLILISIWWAVMFEVVGLGLGVLTTFFWPIDNVLLAVIYIIFMTAAMVSIGIVDILIAVKILKEKESFGEYIKAFGYISLVAGVCEVTVFLSPLALLLVPVLGIILALIFFKDKHEVDFV